MTDTLASAGHPVPIVAFMYNATVLRVIDGDTIEVDVDHGFYLHNTPVPVRLRGCNAAEHGTPGGDAAAANLEALLPVGTPIALVTAKPDKFAPRWDADVTYRESDGRYRDLVADLIAGQWVAPWNGKGEKPLPPWPRTVAATPAEYVARARQRMLDEGEDPDRPVFACDDGQPTHGGGSE